MRSRSPVVVDGLAAHAVLGSQSGHRLPGSQALTKFCHLGRRECGLAALVLASSLGVAQIDDELTPTPPGRRTCRRRQFTSGFRTISRQNRSARPAGTYGPLVAGAVSLYSDSFEKARWVGKCPNLGQVGPRTRHQVTGMCCLICDTSTAPPGRPAGRCPIRDSSALQLMVGRLTVRHPGVATAPLGEWFRAARVVLLGLGFRVGLSRIAKY